MGSAIANRLKLHLQNLSISSGETMHSFRSGCSIIVAMLGVPYQKIAEHVGWKSVDMEMHYTQRERVIAPENANSLLASSATVSAASGARITTSENWARCLDQKIHSKATSYYSKNQTFLLKLTSLLPILLELWRFISSLVIYFEALKLCSLFVFLCYQDLRPPKLSPYLSGLEGRQQIG